MANKEICRTLSKLSLLQCCLVMVIIVQQLSCALGTKSKDVILIENNSTLKGPIAESHNRSKRHLKGFLNSHVGLQPLFGLNKEVSFEFGVNNGLGNEKEHGHIPPTGSYAPHIKYEGTGYAGTRVDITKESTNNINQSFEKVTQKSNTNKHIKNEHVVSTDVHDDYLKTVEQHPTYIAISKPPPEFQTPSYTLQADGVSNDGGLNLNNQQGYYGTNVHYTNNLAPGQHPLLAHVHAHAQTYSKPFANNLASAQYYGQGALNYYDGKALSQQSVSYPNQQPIQPFFFGFKNPQVTPETYNSYQQQFYYNTLPSNTFSKLNSKTFDSVNQPQGQVYSHQIGGHAVAERPSSISLQASYEHSANNLPSNSNNLHINSQGSFHSGIGSYALKQNLPILPQQLQNENHVTAFAGAELSQPTQEPVVSVQKQTTYYSQEPSLAQYHVQVQPTRYEEIVYSHTYQPASQQHTAGLAISHNNDYQPQQSYVLSNAQQQGELHSQQVSELNLHPTPEYINNPKEHHLKPINEGSKQSEQSQSYEHSLNSNYAIVQNPSSFSQQASYEQSATNLPCNSNNFHKHFKTVSSTDIGSHALDKIVYSHTNQPASQQHTAWSAIPNNNDYQQQQQHQQQQSYVLSNANSQQQGELHLQKVSELNLYPTPEYINNPKEYHPKPINEGSKQSEQSQSYEHSLNSNYAVVQSPSSPNLRPSYEIPATNLPSNSNSFHKHSATVSSSYIGSHALEPNLPSLQQQLQNVNNATTFVGAEHSHIQQENSNAYQAAPLKQQQPWRTHIAPGNTNINGNYQAAYHSGGLSIDNISNLNEQNNKAHVSVSLNNQYLPPISTESTKNSIDSHRESHSYVSTLHMTKPPSVPVHYYGPNKPTSYIKTHNTQQESSNAYQAAQPQQHLGATHNIQANVTINVDHQQQPQKSNILEGIKAGVDNIVKAKKEMWTNVISAGSDIAGNLLSPFTQKHANVSGNKH